MSELQDIELIVRDTEQAALEAASFFAKKAAEAISSQDSFRVALCGGSTPTQVYENLVKDPYVRQIDWARTQVFFSDERFVPLDSSESNYRMANQALLSRIPIPPRFVHPVPTEDVPPSESAALYEEAVRRIFGIGLAEVPAFDLIMLGLGPDGHTASLFAGTDALNVSNALVAANFVPSLDSWRITFTYRLINAAKNVLFFVLGENKATIVDRVLAGDSALPAALVEPDHGRVTWIIDKAAASKLSSSSTASFSQDQPPGAQPAPRG